VLFWRIFLFLINFAHFINFSDIFGPGYGVKTPTQYFDPHESFSTNQPVEKAETVAKMQKTVLIPSRDVVNLISRINLPTRQSIVYYRQSTIVEQIG
jgi:hypothetical protein